MTLDAMLLTCGVVFGIGIGATLMLAFLIITGKVKF